MEMLYEKGGYGITKDEDEALKWYKKSGTLNAIEGERRLNNY